MRSGVCGRAAVAVVLLALAAGCGSGSKDTAADEPKGSASGDVRGGGTSAPQEEPEQLTAYDPPVKFTPGNTLPLGPSGAAGVTLDGRQAYTYAPEGGRIVALDLASGEFFGEGAAPEGALPEGYGVTGDSGDDEGPLCEQHPPRTGTVDGKRVAVGVFPTVAKGTGTTADSSTYELVVLDTGTGRSAGRFPLGVPVNGDYCHVAGVSGNTAVVVLGGALAPPDTYGIDLTTGKRVWEKPDFEAQLVLDGRAIGPDSTESGTALASIGAATGKPQWQSPEDVATADYQVALFSEQLLYVGNHDTNGTPQVVSVADGQPRDVEGFGERLHEIQRCVYDRQALTYCFAHTTRGGELAGYDARSAKRLWRVGGVSDTEGRNAPEFWGAFHGAVYGRVMRDGRPTDPIVLDGRTGKDRELQPGAAPQLVNEYAALAGGELYLAAG